MAKHPTSSRVHREDHGPDDAFVNTVKRGYSWGRQNSRAVTILLAVIVIAGIFAIWFISRQNQVEAAASQRLTEVQQSVMSGNTQLAIRDLRTYLDRFGGTETANQARLMLASILIDQDQAQEATEALGDLPGDLDEPFGLAAARLEAAAHEELGNIDQAVSTYLRIADRARFDYQRREALADAARVRLQEGQADQAAGLYERVLETFGEDEAGRGYYELWLAEARAQAEEGGAAPVQPDTAGQDDAEGSTGGGNG